MREKDDKIAQTIMEAEEQQRRYQEELDRKASEHAERMAKARHEREIEELKKKEL